jgi:hypothetical protein
VLSQADVDALKADVEWRAGYLEANRLCAAAWGWDLGAADHIQSPMRGQEWTSWDVRIAKMVRSLWLFEEVEAFNSLQKFAVSLVSVVWNETRGKSFQYGGICLDETPATIACAACGCVHTNRRRLCQLHRVARLHYATYFIYGAIDQLPLSPTHALTPTHSNTHTHTHTHTPSISIAL